MINNLQISGIHSNLTDDVHTYVTKKIGKLERYIPKRARESAFVDVKLKEKKRKNRVVHECKVIVQLPKSVIKIRKNADSFSGGNR